MRSLICPTSSQRLRRSVVRLTGLLMAMLLALFALTGNLLFLGLCVIDYAIRAFTPLAYSPFSWLAARLAGVFKLSEQRIDKAPKLFAARVGFLFALATVALYPFHPAAGLTVGLTLMGFALLESLFDFCVGCLVYTYLVWPLFGKRQDAVDKAAYGHYGHL